jgi:hypothetical protein
MIAGEGEGEPDVTEESQSQAMDRKSLPVDGDKSAII